MKYIKNRFSYLFEQQFQSQDLSTTYTQGKEPKPVSGKTYNLPYNVSWSFKGTGADNLHSFQSNSQGENVGNMNLVVQNWLIHFYNQGINPEVSLVNINIVGDVVSWTVTISESTDGNAWVGFTSRGRGEANDMQGAYDNTYSEQDNKTAKEGIKKLTNSKGEMKGIPTSGGTNSSEKGDWDKVPYFRWVDPKDSKKIKGMVQFFVKFTNPEKYPPHSKSAGGTKSVSSSSTSSNTTSSNTTSNNTTSNSGNATTTTSGGSSIYGPKKSGVKIPAGQVLKVKDVKNLKVGDVLVGTRMTGVKRDVEEPGLYELRVSSPIDKISRENVFDVEIDGENKGLYLAWERDNLDEPLVLKGNNETGHFVNLRMK